MKHRHIRVAEKNLRVGNDHVRTDVRQKSDGLVPPDGRNDAADRWIGKRLHQIRRARLRVSPEPCRIFQCMWSLDDLNSEFPHELFFSDFVAVRERAGTSPGQGDGGNLVPLFELPGFNHLNKSDSNIEL
jgi:hypothetical protein